MKRGLWARLRSEKGSAIMWALVLFVVISAASATTYLILMRDTKEVGGLEERKAHYYAAFAGLEYGYGALMSEYGDGIYLDKFYSDNKTVNDTYEIEGSNPKAKAEVTISVEDLNGTNWVVVKSVGKIDGDENKETLYLRVNPENGMEVHRDGKELSKE